MFDLSFFQENTSNPMQQHVSVAAVRNSKMNSGEIGVATEEKATKNLVRARVRVFEERYGAGILEMNVVCLAFASQENNGGASN